MDSDLVLKCNGVLANSRSVIAAAPCVCDFSAGTINYVYIPKINLKFKIVHALYDTKFATDENLNQLAIVTVSNHVITQSRPSKSLVELRNMAYTFDF